MQEIDVTNPKVLIVDDMPKNLVILREILEPCGFEIYAATHGKKALQISRTVVPDLVLLDIMMPEIDGYEVCRELKADAVTREIPVIFLSALNAPEDKVAAFEVGGIDYVSKPFNADEVLARVKAHLKTGLLIYSLNNLIRRTFHEIYTPLSIIDTGTDMQVLEYGNTEYLDGIKSASRTLHTIYEDLYYAVKKEITPYEREPIELNSFLVHRIAYFSVVARTKEMTFETVFDSDGPVVLMNANELERIIDNTLSNAIKYGDMNTVITIGIEELEDTATLRITNRGRTIEKEQKVFDALYREAEQIAGLGLGLEIVGMICRKYGIGIHVDSRDGMTEFAYTFRSEHAHPSA